MAAGNPHCSDCNGRGGWFRHGRWFPCQCVKPRKSVLELQRKYNQTKGHEYKSLSERIREQREDK